MSVISPGLTVFLYEQGRTKQWQNECIAGTRTAVTVRYWGLEIHRNETAPCHYSCPGTMESQSLLALADPRGGARDARPPLSVQISSISCSFWGKLAKIIGWRPHLCSWRTPLWEILDPPLAWVGKCEISARGKLKTEKLKTENQFPSRPTCNEFSVQADLTYSKINLMVWSSTSLLRRTEFIWSILEVNMDFVK